MRRWLSARSARPGRPGSCACSCRSRCRESRRTSRDRSGTCGRCAAAAAAPWLPRGLWPEACSGEHGELAGVPVAHAHAARGVAFVDDVEAVARRAGVGAGAAAEAAQRGGLPLRALVSRRRGTRRRPSRSNCVGGPRRDWPLLVGRLASARRTAPCPFRSGSALRTSPSPSSNSMTSEPRVVAGPEPTDVQKQCVVVLAAGQRHDGGQLAAAVVELVLVVPVEHVIEDRQRGGVARPRADDDLLGRRRLGGRPARSACPRSGSRRASRAAGRRIP